MRKENVVSSDHAILSTCIWYPRRVEDIIFEGNAFRSTTKGGKRIRKRRRGIYSPNRSLLFLPFIYPPTLCAYAVSSPTLLFFALTLANQRERNPLAYFPAGSPALFTHVLVKKERKKERVRERKRERNERKEKLAHHAKKELPVWMYAFGRFVTREGEEERGMENGYLEAKKRVGFEGKHLL